MSRNETRLQKRYDREGRNTSSMDPKMMNARVFIGNLAADKVTRQDVVKLFEPFGKVLGASLHKSYGFVQFENEKDARTAVKATHGTTVQGLRVDVNIATERRKETAPERPHGGGGGFGGSRRPRSPSPSFRPPLHPHHRFEMDRPHPPPMRWERERLGWRGPGGGSPPPMGGGPYQDRDFDRGYPPPHMRDHYVRPRDDPYDRYPPRGDRERYVAPSRDYYSSPRDNFPPHYRDRYPYDYPPPRGRGSPPPPNFDRGGLGPEWDRRVSIEDWERERDKRGPVVPPARQDVGVGDKRSADMVIIVINRQQRDYAALVAGRVRELGLVVETDQLSPTVSLADSLDSAAQEGLLYAVIITSQHELHNSVTLTILHGRNPQEHKNMPLDDALSLISKDFDHYMISGRAAIRQAPSVDVPQLLGKAASGASLSSNELTAVITALQKQKQQDELPSQHVAPPVDKVDTNTPEDIQRQQADLQAKILSLLGSSAVVPSSAASSSSPVTTKTRLTVGSYDAPTHSGSISSNTGSSTVSYPQQSYSNSSSGYHSSYGNASSEGGNNSGYGGGGAGYGAYNYR